jgi:hypothetical protein
MGDHRAIGVQVEREGSEPQVKSLRRRGQGVRPSIASGAAMSKM